MMSTNAILASTSTLYGEKYLQYLVPLLKEFLKDSDELLFIPYAQPSGISLDDYTNLVKASLSELNIKVVGLNSFKNKKEAILNAQAIFTGGGNTFLLLKTLYDFDLIQPLKERINNGTKYIGTSAGTNITGLTINTTNDMPIVYPPSFDALGIVAFNINPHYLDPIEGLKHKGETRETRITEFHKQSDIPVFGLREGSWIEVKNGQAILKGNLTARFFNKEKAPVEVSTGTDLMELL